MIPNLDKIAKANMAFEEYKNKKAEIIENNLPLPGKIKAKIYFPVTKILLFILTKIAGEKIYFLNQKKVKTPKGRPIIYACTHKFKPDIEKISMTTNKPSAFMASDFKNSYRTISGWYFGTRPTVFVDPYSKEDKRNTYKMMVRYLKEGNSFMIFPEAVWNLSENKIVLDIFNGAVRAAFESNAVIVCTAIERYGKNYVINRHGYLDVAEILKNNPDKSFEEVVKTSNDTLRDYMATLTYEIWEAYADKYGVTSRKEIPNNYWDEFIEQLTSEWQGYKISDNVEQRFHSKAEREQEQIKTDLSNIKPRKENAFLFDKRLKG